MQSALFFGLLFGAIGLALICILAKILFHALVGDTRGWMEKFRFRQKQKLLKHFDELSARGASGRAFEALRGGFFLDHVYLDADLIDRISGHHAGVLSRISVLAEQNSRSLPNFAVLEDLLQSRCELMRLYVETVTSKRLMSRNPKKQIPRWALDEYRRKLDDIVDRLKTNRHSIESQIKELFSALKDSTTGESGVTYH